MPVTETDVIIVGASPTGLTLARELREIVAELLLDEPAARRVGTLIAGADIRYPMPG